MPTVGVASASRKSDLEPAEPEDGEAYTKGRDAWGRELCEDWEAHGGDVYWGLEGRAELRTSAERYVAAPLSAWASCRGSPIGRALVP